MVDWLFFVSGSWTLRFSYKSHEIHTGFLHFWTKTALSPKRRASDVHETLARVANLFSLKANGLLGLKNGFMRASDRSGRGSDGPMIAPRWPGRQLK